MTDKAILEKADKLRREGRLSPCYPVRRIVFFPETGLEPRCNCYMSPDPLFISVWEPGSETPDLINTKAIMCMEGKGTATDGRKESYCIIPDQWEE